MSGVNRIELVEHFPTSGTNCIGNTDEFTPIANMVFQVIQQFLWDV
jgi:hypothetical protein